jgi:hypothetical protein
MISRFWFKNLVKRCLTIPEYRKKQLIAILSNSMLNDISEEETLKIIKELEQ